MRQSTSSHDIVDPVVDSDTGAYSSISTESRRRLARRRRPISSGLGWLSIGLGLAELVAPRALARSIGMGERPRTVRTLRGMGLREIATGIGILASRRRTPFLWLRVGGDMIDLALLQRSIAACNRDAARLRTALSVIAGVTAIDTLAARRSLRNQRQVGAGPRAQMVTAVVTIRRTPDEVYGFFRELSNLPLFMNHLQSVEEESGTRSHWRVRGPGGRSFEWDAEIVKERPGELLSWRSLPGGDIHSDGVVRFKPAPGGRGTEVHAKIRYHAPGGRLGAAIAKLFGREPGQQARADLRRLKQVLETGEVMRSDASIHPGMHAAQPTEEPRIEGSSYEETAR